MKGEAARKEAAEAGFWQTKSLAGTKHPRLQILTIEELYGFHLNLARVRRKFGSASSEDVS